MPFSKTKAHMIMLSGYNQTKETGSYKHILTFKIEYSGK